MFLKRRLLQLGVHVSMEVTSNNVHNVLILRDFWIRESLRIPLTFDFFFWLFEQKVINFAVLKISWLKWHKVKRCMCISHYIQNTLAWKISKEVGRRDDQCSSITKGCIWHIKHNVHTVFNHGSGLIWNCMVKEVPMFDVCTYCIFTLYNRVALF